MYGTTLTKASGHIVNEMSQNDIKALVMSDSFNVAVNQFLCLSYKEIVTLRNGLTSTYIEDYKPDTIVMFYNAGVFGMDGIYDYCED